jgi:D-alanyl-D-alanine endopeptidase (penicillin-binding protein 7)
MRTKKNHLLAAACLSLGAFLALAHPLAAEAGTTTHRHHAATRHHAVRHASATHAEAVSASPGVKSEVALVLDQDTHQVLYSKNPDEVHPIASITKLMTALVVEEARQPMDEKLTITEEDVDTLKHSASRLAVGTTLTREEMLHLALMASENRAAHCLGRNYPGGLPALVAAMNRKASQLGMTDTHYVEPTGLSSDNRSTAHDLALLVAAAHEDAVIRELSTSKEYQVAVGRREVEFRSTNALVRNPRWDIGLQKTGFINEAGHCMVMQAKLLGRQVILVLLDSAGKYTRFADAERIRKWLASGHGLPSATAEESPSRSGDDLVPKVTS